MDEKGHVFRRGDKFACIFLAWPVEKPKFFRAQYMSCTVPISTKSEAAKIYHGPRSGLSYIDVYRVYHNAGCRYVVLGCAASMFLLGEIWIAVTSTNAGSMHYTLIDSQNLSLQ